MFKTTVRISGTLLALTIALLLPLSAWATSYHTIAIDGTNDFASDESVPGTSGSTWYFTWDSTSFYFGVDATDVASGSGTEWVHLYLDTDPHATPLSGDGVSSGVLYNTQQPTLPFHADFHFRWKTDNTYTNLLDWNNSTSSWTDDNTDSDNFDIAAYQNGTYVEFSIPRSGLGDPAALYVAGAMINEASGVESTFFMAPNTNTEGYDTSYTNYFGFVLDAGIAPNSADNVDCHPAIIVTSNANNGAGTLRQAITKACVGGNITFSGNTDIYLASELAIAKRLTIDGGSHAVKVSGDTGNDGSPNVRVFDISASGVVTLNHLSIVSGTVTDLGGGICNYGTLTVQNSTFADNSATGRGIGGGIFNQGTLTVLSSSFTGNSSSNGGGINNNVRGTLTMVNTTLSGNLVPGWTQGIGGGIINWGILRMTNCTLSDNSAPSGGGIRNLGTLHYRNTIIANNSGDDCRNSGTIGDNVNNLVENNACSPAFSGDPSLDALALFGGRTLTHALLPNSPAIDAGAPAYCPTTDQRGKERVDLRCDIGAFELRYADSDTVIKSSFGGGVPYSFGPTWISMTLEASDTGSITVTKHLTYPGGMFDEGEMQATWWISSNLTTPFTATLDFCYTDLEVAGLDEATLQAYRWSGAQWLPQSSTPDPDSNCITVANVNAFSAWTLVGSSAPNALTIRILAADGSPWAGLLLVVLSALLFQQAWRKPHMAG